MKVYILGVDHAIQVANDNRRTGKERLLFAGVVTEILTQHRIQFIGEETFLDRASIARIFAGFRDLPWEAIEMSEEAREMLGISKEQTDRRYALLQANPKPETRVRSDYIREEYMAWKALRNAEGLESILVICGFMHSENLKRIFEREGHQVTVDSLCQRDWYSNPDCPGADS